jgi:hypothetical protein
LLVKFIIFAPSYSQESGGVAVLHRLCHLLNENGYQAFLYPAHKTQVIHQSNWFRPMLSMFAASLKSKFFRPFKTRGDFNTPVFNGSIKPSDDYVAIYSEGVMGNPLGAKYVVRWLLHQPGYNYKLTCFGNCELMFAYSRSYAHNFQLPFSKLAETLVYLPYENLTHYNQDGALPFEERKGVAYCLRKGGNKARVHDESDSILIDGLSHSEISNIFKRVKTFISYDTKTAFSAFASICGADSIVIPDPGVKLDAWEPDAQYRYGIAYGFENIAWARETRPLMMARINNDINRVPDMIHSFVEEVNLYFPCEPFR